MRLNSTFKFFKVLALVVAMLVSTNIYATNGVKEGNKKGTQKDQQKEQADQPQATDEVQPAVAPAKDTENNKEEGVSISNVSFNFIFYLIYKIKYAELFKLPARKKEDASSHWSGVNLNRLYQKLTKPNI